MREGLLKMKNIYIKFWLFWLSFSLKGAIINKYIEGDIGRFNHFLSVAYLSSQSKSFSNYKNWLRREDLNQIGRARRQLQWANCWWFLGIWWRLWF